jgi:hypothetical protein
MPSAGMGPTGHFEPGVELHHRAEAIAFTEMILRLGRTPRGKLR